MAQTRLNQAHISVYLDLAGRVCVVSPPRLADCVEGHKRVTNLMTLHLTSCWIRGLCIFHRHVSLLLRVAEGTRAHTSIPLCLALVVVAVVVAVSPP